MGRVQVTVGTRYRWDGRVYVVRQLVGEGGLLVEDQTGGGQAVVARADLQAAWGAGALTFAGAGVRTGSAPDTSAGRATIADFHLLPEGQRAEAWRRYALIQPLLAVPAGERTRGAIERYLAGEGVPTGQGEDRAGGAGTPTASRGSVERYLRAYEASGGDIRSLVPATQRRGGGKRSRLDAEVDGLIQGVLAECRAAPAQRTVRAVYLMIVARVREANRGRPATDPLPLPGRSTIYRRVGAEGAVAILRRRPGPGERRAGAGVWPGPRVGRPLERVELDHTVLDLIVVDEEERLPIGRPTVTLALDVYSGFPAGIHVGFEAAGYGAAMRCLLHAILPKEDARARYGTAHPWPVYGLPEVLVVDHAPHLVGGDLEDACGQLGIRLEPAPVKRPWFKGAIERQFRTHNTGLVHGLPGTTFSTVLARGEYDAAGMACISLARFREILHVYLLDVYGQDWNRGVEGVPAQRWAAAVAGGWTPALHHDAEEMRLLLGRGAVRTIQRAGIDHLSLRYQSRELDALRRALPAGTPVALKYDPEDLGALHVQMPAAQRDPEGPAWLRVPALHQEYANGLSLWKHRVIQGQARVERGRAVHNAAEEQPELTQAAGTIEGRIDHRGAGQIRLEGVARVESNATMDPVVVLAPETVDPLEIDVVDRVLTLATTSPKLALIDLSIEIERELRELTASMGYIPRSPTVRAMVDVLTQKGILPRSISAAVDQFWHVRNQSVHGFTATTDDIVSAIDSGLTILKLIRAIPTSTLTVQHPGIDVYSDAEGTQKREGVLGLILESTSPNGLIHSRRIVPIESAIRTYQKGESVSNEWANDPMRTAPMSWYHDSSTGQVERVWNNTPIFIGRPLEDL